MYGAEMDGILSDEILDLDTVDLNKLHFVELKVKLKEERENQKRNYLKFKLRNWWCQCFLVNIKRIIVGIRNQNGIVHQLTDVDVHSIPKQVKVFLFLFSYQKKIIINIVLSQTFQFSLFRIFGHLRYAWNFVANLFDW